MLIPSLDLFESFYAGYYGLYCWAYGKGLVKQSIESKNGDAMLHNAPAFTAQWAADNGIDPLKCRWMVVDSNDRVTGFGGADVPQDQLPRFQSDLKKKGIKWSEAIKESAHKVTSCGVDLKGMDVEFYDDEGSTILNVKLEQMAKELRWKGTVARADGWTTGGSHEDGSYERLRTHRDVDVFDFDPRDDDERDDAEKEFKELVTKWAKQKRNWTVDVEFV